MTDSRFLSRASVVGLVLCMGLWTPWSMGAESPDPVPAPVVLKSGCDGSVRHGETASFWIQGSDDGKEAWASGERHIARIWIGTKPGQWDVLAGQTMSWDADRKCFSHAVSITGQYPQTYHCAMLVYNERNQANTGGTYKFGRDASGRVYELADTAPTVTATSFTDMQVTNSSRPTLSWAYSDVDDNAQSHYQVQLADHAAFSSPSFDSGEQASSTGAHTLEGLTDGVWYWRVRVKDGYQWSAWSSASQFKVNAEALVQAQAYEAARALAKADSNSASEHLFLRAPKKAAKWTHDRVPREGSVEIPGSRNEYSRIFQNADGTKTWESHTAPIHYQDAQGEWKPINCGLVAGRDGYAYQNTTNMFESYFAAEAGGYHRFKQGTLTIDFALLGAGNAQPVIDGESIAYPNAMDGVDLQYTVFSSNLKEDIILTRNTGRNSFKFEIKLPKFITYRVNDQGVIELIDAANDRISEIAKPYMYDHTWTDNHNNGIDDGAYSEAVRYDLATEDGKLILTVTADQAWLDDPARVWPVTIDPTFTSQRETVAPWPRDTYVSSGCPDTCWSTSLGVGTLLRTGWRSGGPQCAANTIWRALLRFNDPPISNTDQVCHVTLHAQPNAQLGGGFGHNIYRHPVNQLWSWNTATWNNTGGASHEGGPGTYQYINAVNTWFHWDWDGWGPWLNDSGYVLRCDTESGAVNWSVTWYGGRYSYTASPYIDVTYDNEAPWQIVNMAYQTYNPGNPAPNSDLFGNQTSWVTLGQANDSGCRGLRGVRETHWGYNGSSDWNWVTTSGANWSHSVAGFNGHNRWHFQAIDWGTLTSAEWNNSGGSNYFDIYIDSMAPYNPSFSAVNVLSTSQIGLSWAIPLDRAVGAPDGTDELAEEGGANRYRRGDVGVLVRRGPTTLYGWGTGTSANDTGLSANTAYTYTIEARDNTGQSRGAWANTTGEQGSTTRYTFIEGPAGVAFGTITQTSIDVSPTGSFSNLTAGSSGVRVTNTVAASDSGWVQNTNAWTSTGLTPNTVYTFSAESRNGDGVSAGTAGGSRQTHAAAPTIGDNVTCDKSVSTPYPAGTVFTFSNPAGFGDGTHGGNAFRAAYFAYVWDNNPTYEFTGGEETWNSGDLPMVPAGDGNYYLHLRSVNGDGVYTAPSLDYGPFIFDGTVPAVVSIVPSTTGPTNADSVSFTVTFSEEVSGFDLESDVAVNHSGTAAAGVAIVANSGSEYVVTITGITGDGTLSLNVPADAAIDAASNGNTAGGPSDAVTIDNALPAVTVEQAVAQEDPTGTLPIYFTVTFSEAVSGFSADDVTMGGSATGVVFNVSGGPAVYTIEVTAIAEAGTVSPSIAADAATDEAGNGNAASTSLDNSVLFAQALPPTILTWSSVRTHGNGVGSVGIPLDADGSHTPVSEPRQSGVLKLVVTFDNPAQAADGTLDAADVLVDGSSVEVAGVALSNGNLTLTIDLNTLTDQALHTVDLSGKFKAAGAPYPAMVGDADCEFRNLAGDVNGDGVVNLIDAGMARTFNLAAVTAATVRSDVNGDGLIDLADSLATIGFYGHAAP